MTDLRVTEQSDRWLLPVAGQQVTRCCADYAAVALLLLNGVEFYIQGTFTFDAADGQRHLLDPEADDGLALAPILGLRRRDVGDGAAFKDGRLLINFADGSRIDVPPDARYEPWTLSGPKGLTIVSVPGGELSIWGGL